MNQICAQLLEGARAIEGDDGDCLYWAPFGARCVGADPLVTPTGFRLRPGTGSEDGYAAVRPHRKRNAPAFTTLFPT